MHAQDHVIMEVAHLGGGATDRKIGRDLPADAAFPTGMKKQIRNQGPRPPGHRMDRPALTRPLQPYVAVGANGHISVWSLA